MQVKNILATASVVIMLCVFGSSVFASPADRLLTKNEELHPQGWTVGEQVKFKKGTKVIMNQYGAVISGVLANNTYLRPQGWQRIINDYYLATAYTDHSFFFPRYYRYWNNGSIYNMALPSYGHIRYKEGTAVTFTTQGAVLSGTIADKAAIALGTEQYGFVSFKSGSVLTFYNSGAVKEGTLSEDTKLHPVGWQNNAVNMDNAGFVEFKAKSVVSLTPSGEVISCRIKDALKWKDAGVEIDFFPNTVVYFTQQGARAIMEKEKNN